MYQKITGVILAGGKSTRMQTEKAFLKYGNINFIQNAANLMCSLFQEVIIISNTPYSLNFLNLPIFEDIYKEKGPLAGIHSALVNSNTNKIFIIPCDMPFISTELIKEIVEYPSKLPVVICKTNDFIHAQVGIYHKSIIPIVNNILTGNNNTENEEKRYSKILQIQKHTEIEIIEATKLNCFNSDLFFNINNPNDYKEFILKIKS